jgi:hypothetical protein
MNEVNRISFTVTFDDGTTRRKSINAEDLSFFEESVIGNIFELDTFPADLSSVGLEQMR